MKFDVRLTYKVAGGNVHANLVIDAVDVTSAYIEAVSGLPLAPESLIDAHVSPHYDPRSETYAD